MDSSSKRSAEAAVMHAAAAAAATPRAPVDPTAFDRSSLTVYLKDVKTKAPSFSCVSRDGCLRVEGGLLYIACFPSLYLCRILTSTLSLPPSVCAQVVTLVLENRPEVGVLYKLHAGDP
jgi:hypothetical protein